MAALPPVPAYRAQPIRIACVQLDPKLGCTAENAAKIESMTARLTPGAIDLLVLPEMALSGYMYTSASAILPHLEHPRTGPTALLARGLAKRLGCHVVAGYPEALGEGEENDPEPVDASAPAPSSDPVIVLPGASEVPPNGATTVTAGPPKPPNGISAPWSELVGYNSALLAGPDGGVLGNYRKSFLYETDKRWARPGSGFAYWDLPAPLGRVALGICMDLNPKDFIAPWNAYELSGYCARNRVDMLVVPMNWLDPGEQDSDSGSSSATTEDDPDAPPPWDANAPSESNLNYWAARLAPLHDPAPGYDGETAGGHETVFVACNRSGVEAGTRFAGTSCVMTMRSEPRAIELVECCTRAEERVMLAVVT